LASYCQDVDRGDFPGAEHSFNMRPEELARVLED